MPGRRPNQRHAVVPDFVERGAEQRQFTAGKGEGAAVCICVGWVGQCILKRVIIGLAADVEDGEAVSPGLENLDPSFVVDAAVAIIPAKPPPTGMRVASDPRPTSSSNRSSLSQASTKTLSMASNGSPLVQTRPMCIHGSDTALPILHRSDGPGPDWPCGVGNPLPRRSPALATAAHWVSRPVQIRTGGIGHGGPSSWCGRRSAEQRGQEKTATFHVQRCAMQTVGLHPS